MDVDMFMLGSSESDLRDFRYDRDKDVTEETDFGDAVDTL